MPEGLGKDLEYSGSRFSHNFPLNLMIHEEERALKISLDDTDVTCGKCSHSLGVG